METRDFKFWFRLPGHGEPCGIRLPAADATVSGVKDRLVVSAENDEKLDFITVGHVRLSPDERKRVILMLNDAKLNDDRNLDHTSQIQVIFKFPKKTYAFDGHQPVPLRLPFGRPILCAEFQL
jgi:hypothetical protein